MERVELKCKSCSYRWKLEVLTEREKEDPQRPRSGVCCPKCGGEVERIG